MKNSYWLLVFFVASCLIYSCKTKTHQNEVATVSIVCLKENDTLDIKIINHTGKTIFIPKQYHGCYTINSDTLYLETTDKDEYGVDYYYEYKNIFPFDFFTTKRIPGYIPDSVEKHISQTAFYNQFRVQPILPLLPDSSYTIRLQFNIPKHVYVAKAVYYYIPFLNKEQLDRVDYLREDFLKFDSINANHVTAPIFVRYR